jgi:hypothetical protein
VCVRARANLCANLCARVRACVPHLAPVNHAIDSNDTLPRQPAVLE